MTSQGSDAHVPAKTAAPDAALSWLLSLARPMQPSGELCVRVNDATTYADAQVREAEARIVAWLRERGERHGDNSLVDDADRVAEGEHRP